MAMGGLAYHVLNRAVRRATLFEHDGDYAAFERVLGEAHERTGMRIAAYCIMPSHWHLVLWPRADGELSEFMRWLTVTHTQRWHANRHTAGTGPVYQGRFKSFPIQRDHHFLTVCRYVERNALRARLVRQAQDWTWCSLTRRAKPKPNETSWLLPTSKWPVPPPRNWVVQVNRSDDPEVQSAVQHAIRRGAPFGGPAWQQRTAVRLGLESTLRPRGRPLKSARPANAD
jgi:putative transposase